MTNRARRGLFLTGCLLALCLAGAGGTSGAEAPPTVTTPPGVPTPPPAAAAAKSEEDRPKTVLQVEPAPTVDQKGARSLQAAPKTTKPQKKRAYGGSLTKISKSKNPLQMLNPFAPKKYGTGDDVVNRDPVTGKVQGVNLFTVEF